MTPHVWLSGLGALATSASYLVFLGFYSVEEIGRFSLFATVAAVGGMIGNGKVQVFSLTADSEREAAGFVLTAALLSVATGLLFALGGLAVWCQSSTEAIALGALAGGTAAFASFTAERQRRDGLVQLGAGRAVKGIGLVALSVVFAGRGALGLELASAGSTLVGTATLALGYRVRAVGWPRWERLREGAMLSTTSLQLGGWAAAQQFILEAWFGPTLFGLYAIITRVARGALTWPGAVLVDVNLTRYSRGQPFGAVRSAFSGQAAVLAAVVVGALGVVVVALLYLGRYASHVPVIAGATLMETAAIFYVTLYRPYLGLNGLAGWQGGRELVAGIATTSLLYLGYTLFAPSIAVYAAATILPTVWLVRTYRQRLVSLA